MCIKCTCQRCGFVGSGLSCVSWSLTGAQVSPFQEEQADQERASAAKEQSGEIKYYKGVYI